MPNQSLLKLVRGSHEDTDFSRGLGNFWSSQTVPTLEDIKWNQAKLIAQISKNGTNDINEIVVDDVIHLGHMIAAYSESKIPEFSERLANAQRLGEDYQRLRRKLGSVNDISGHYKETVDESLALSKDNREALMETLKSVRSFDGYNNVENKYVQPTLSSMKVGEIFPQQWKDKITEPINIRSSLDLTKEEEELYGNEYAGFYDQSQNTVMLHDFDARGIGHSMDGSHAELVASQNNPFNQGVEDYYVVAGHEFGHVYESLSPKMLEFSMEFLRKRVIRYPNGNEVIANNNRAVDHFPDDYTGTYYIRDGDTYPYTTEVISMGMEGTLLGTQGSFLGLPSPHPTKDSYQLEFHRADPEYRNFMLGILAAFEIE